MKSLLAILIIFSFIGCSHSNVTTIETNGKLVIVEKGTPKKSIEIITQKGLVMFTFHRTSADSDTLGRFSFLGKEGLKVRFLYEEFVNNYSIPSFGKIFKYNMGNGSAFKYKSILIDIISVSDSQIKFVVIQ